MVERCSDEMLIRKNLRFHAGNFNAQNKREELHAASTLARMGGANESELAFAAEHYRLSELA